MSEIKHVIYTQEVTDDKVLQEFDCELLPALDSRSAVYMATGIAAQNKETVLVVLSSSNSSRSAFSGMTEAYYRKLPVVLVTVGKNLNYDQEIKDVVNSHFTVSRIEDINELLDKEMPMHIELDNKSTNFVKANLSVAITLADVLQENDYLYCSVNNFIPDCRFKCKIVRGGMMGCQEGALANVLGASLTKKRRRYVGLVNEDEFLHDMNTLGNINVNDSLVYIVCCKRKNRLIKDYSESLGFQYSFFTSAEIKEKNINKVLCNGKKSIICLLMNDENSIC